MTIEGSRAPVYLSVQRRLNEMVTSMNKVGEKTPEYNHPGVPTQVARELWEQGRIKSLEDFEAGLRFVGKNSLYCIAVPRSKIKEGFEIEYPQGKRQEKPEYVLHVAMTKEEAQGRLEELKITQEENLQRLKTTGFLTTKK